VSSRDGSLISYEASGSGPLIVLVAGALADRTDARKLAAQLSTSFTVVNYDRRGRGASTAARPYYEGCEVHDIESLLAAMGGRGFLFGSSSGGVLALDAAAALANVDGVVVYEPPFIVSDGRAPDPSRFVPAITDAVGAGRLDDAARLFFIKSMGIPALGVLLMRHLMPSWKKMAAMAPTLLHDFAILKGTQDRRPLPTTRWDSLTAPLLVLVGGKSEAFFHEGAKALTEQLPGARYSSLDGRNHSAVMTAPTAIAAEIRRFLLSA
jgi:pimeloyl-ACP methyl ester carboxylesterase